MHVGRGRRTRSQAEEGRGPGWLSRLAFGWEVQAALEAWSSAVAGAAR